MADLKFECDCKPIDYSKNKGVAEFDSLSAPKVVKELLAANMPDKAQSRGEAIDQRILKDFLLGLTETPIADFFFRTSRNKIAEKKALTKALKDFQVDALTERVKAQPESEKKLSLIIINPASAFGETGKCSLVKLIQSLPAETKVIISTQDKAIQDYFRKNLTDNDFSRLSFSTVTGTVYLQDWAKINGDTAIVPLQKANQLHPDEQGRSIHLAALEQNFKALGLKVVTAPFIFDGGNVTVLKKKDGTSLVCIGASDYLVTRDLYRSQGLSIDEPTFVKMVKSIFRADQAVILGERDNNGELQKQIGNAFHLDQVFFSLSPGLVAAAKPIPSVKEKFLNTNQSSEVKNTVRMISHIRFQLEELGFNIADVPTSTLRLYNSESYMNSLVFKKDQKTVGILMPAFADRVARKFSEPLKPPPIDSQSGENFEAIKAVKNSEKQIGLKVEPALVPFFESRNMNGNFHCITLRIP